MISRNGKMQKCLSVHYCLQHQGDFEQKHQEIVCNRFILWLNIELSSARYENTLKPLELRKFPDNQTPIDNMVEFIEEYVQNKKGEWNALDYVYSDYVSGPLSVYYGMSQAELSDVLLTRSTCIIHIVQASSVERNGLPAWEILLHLFPNIQELAVILLQTELETKLQYEIGMQKICPNCDCNKKQFFYECCSTTYSDYRANGLYKKADLIICFESLFAYGLFDECLITMQSQQCPVLLTSPKNRALHEIAKIQQVLNRDVYPFSFKNKFESLRPHKFTECILYRNSFLTVYKTLRNINDTIESSS
ncbi:uncharacterized protein LOC105185043 [Harpegnathos saltator]|uniref:uncharacterized protein LOC105185043 n=1 Tax=Harpegnathos saltator TaxID=610380 RepID=UPI000DBEE4CD|nr:uncharacterized protein LOC105185043 [Harpegnathos saltator]